MSLLFRAHTHLQKVTTDHRRDINNFSVCWKRTSDKNQTPNFHKQWVTCEKMFFALDSALTSRANPTMPTTRRLGTHNMCIAAESQLDCLLATTRFNRCRTAMFKHHPIKLEQVANQPFQFSPGGPCRSRHVSTGLLRRAASHPVGLVSESYTRAVEDRADARHCGVSSIRAQAKNQIAQFHPNPGRRIPGGAIRNVGNICLRIRFRSDAHDVCSSVAEVSPCGNPPFPCVSKCGCSW